MRLRAPVSALFPYTTLFRSEHPAQLAVDPQRVQRRAVVAQLGRLPGALLVLLGAQLRHPVRGLAARGRERLERRAQRTVRSEEHTSELQSQSNLVCRLLLEK